jgi:2-polyprenylphenol 6-hydroxylase
VVSAMRGFKMLFEQRSPMLRFVRNAGMSMVDRHYLLKGLLARQALGRFDDAPLI